MGEIIADLPEEEQQEIWGDYTEEQMKAIAYDWNIWGRPEQMPPEDGSWRIFLALAGRGWGKSRAGAEWIRKKVEDADKAGKPIEILLLGRTAADVRDVMVKAILECSPPENKPDYSPSNRKLTWPGGSYALCTSSEKPDQLRGPSAHYGWADELAALKATKDDAGTTAWANLLFAVREGKNPQIFGTTTPKRTPLMKQLVKDSSDPDRRIKMVKGSTFDNTSLSAAYLDDITSQYEGSDLAKQELFGEMLLDAEGLFFTEQMIEDATIDPKAVPRLPLKFIAVDPSVAERPGDECGIVAVGVTGERNPRDRTAYILEDYSIKGDPEVWVNRVVEAAKEHRTKFIVVEGNQGRKLLTMVLNTADPSLKIFLVNASQGKYKRAEPVIIAMQQKRVKLVDLMPDLTDQMMFFDPENTKASPDRMDAMVWGVIAALVDPPDGLRVHRSRITSPENMKIAHGRGTGSGSSKRPIQKAGTRFGAMTRGSRFG
jgi:phage terminase large subunit-like protein